MRRILHLGKGTQLVKVDLKQAPPGSCTPSGPTPSGERSVYVDRALSFGLRSAPKIFTAVADMIAWALHMAGIQDQIHYLDDFLFLGPPANDVAARALSVALWILDHLGFPVAMHKTEGPTCCITFLGIIIDTEAFKLRLPAEKLYKLQALLSSWCARKSHTKKELESLLGHLSYAATVVHPGRTFLHQLFSLLHLTKAPHHFVCQGAGARADLAWWKCFLQSWSWSSFFPLPNPSHNVYFDAMDAGQLWTHLGIFNWSGRGGGKK